MKIFSIRFKFFFIALAFLLFLPYSGQSQEQEKIGFELRSYLQERLPEDRIPLLVEANESAFFALIETYRIRVHLSLENLHSIDLPQSEILAFSKEPAIETIEFSMQEGVALSDTMLIQTNVDSIVQAFAPILTPLTGKGVVMGFIDSGIEINHPDFQDSLGNSRIQYIWDQGVAYNPSRKPGNYAYGIEWTKADIDAGTCTHDDKANEFGHGSMVTGAAASNANGSGQYRGVAPEVEIIAVATNFSRPNWLQSVAEAVDYIYSKADSLGLPCVINASVGTYRGSHDGKDIAARMIDLLIKQKSGRSFVCAAGNAGALKFHLQHAPQNDTVFSWFEHHPALFAGQGGVYFEIWSDTADFKNLEFAIGADRESNQQFEFRGRTPFSGIQGRLFQVVRDTLWSSSGNRLAFVDTYAEESQGRYKIEVALIQPDSSNYLYRLETSGVGKLDLWANYSLQRSAELKTSNLPSAANFPPMAKYVLPDSLQTMVSSFTCLPSVVTVGNYVNRNTYIDVNGNLQTMGAVPGKMSEFSSLGPNRQGIQKPDLSSAGDYMMASGRIATMNQLIQIEPQKISQDSLHMRNGGTSMASPTVAGMVALKLQQCPNSSASQLLSGLIQTARKDAFTPSAGSYKWGAGKADGFQYLASSAFQAQITPPAGPYCGLDSIQISTTNNYIGYLWNTGDTTRFLEVDSSGTYWLVTRNANGCLAQSNSVQIKFDTLPNSPKIQRSNDSLWILALGQYQWFYNQSAISNAQQAYFIANQTGSYHCLYTDTSTGCSRSSDTLQINITSTPSYRSIEMGIYPNPSQGIVQLKTKPSLSRMQIQLLDVSGKVLFQKQIEPGEQHISLDFSLYPKGTYLLSLQNKNEKAYELIQIL